VVVSETKAYSLFAASRHRTFLAGLLLVVATLAVYNSAAKHPFVNYDDNRYVTENTHVRDGLQWSTVRWAFATTEQANWHPLTWLSHALDCQLFQLNPAGHHYVNILFHALDVVLLYLVFGWSTGAWGRSAVVAGLFALHPIQVESVAWVSERKNLLSLAFFLLALAAYKRYAIGPSLKRYIVVALLFAGGLMAKPQVITFPCVLLLWDYWPLNRLAEIKPAACLRLLAEKIPLFVLSGASALITIVAQRSGGAMAGISDYSFVYRVGNAAVAYLRYFGKAIWPSRLAPFYPYQPVTPLKLVAALLVVGITTVIVLRFRERRYLVVGCLWFLGTLVPMIGLVQVGDQAMADRYAYLPFIGLFLMAAWGMADIAEQFRVPARSLAVVAFLVPICLAAATYRQLGYWRDNLALWTRTLEVTRNNYVAEDNLAGALIMAGHFDEAIPHFREAARINPRDGNANLNLGAYEQQQGNFRRAIEHYQVVVHSIEEPQLLSLAFSNMGFAFRGLRDAASARQSFEASVRAETGNAKAWLGLGLVAQQAGDYSGAAASFAHAMAIQPSDFGYLLLSQSLEKSGRGTEARAALEEAQRLSKNFQQTEDVVRNLLAN
jgi:tetratricopeptide (TPR) repeat protein